MSKRYSYSIKFEFFSALWSWVGSESTAAAAIRVVFSIFIRRQTHTHKSRQIEYHLSLFLPFNRHATTTYLYVITSAAIELWAGDRNLGWNWIQLKETDRPTEASVVSSNRQADKLTNWLSATS